MGGRLVCCHGNPGAGGDPLKGLGTAGRRFLDQLDAQGGKSLEGLDGLVYRPGSVSVEPDCHPVAGRVPDGPHPLPVVGDRPTTDLDLHRAVSGSYGQGGSRPQLPSSDADDQGGHWYRIGTPRGQVAVHRHAGGLGS